MTYEAWRCTYQSSEQAARAAYERAQELEAQLAAAQQGVPASVIAGAIFDFAGYLTTLPAKDVIHCSEVHAAGPIVEAFTEWAEKRGLSLASARVENWRDALATHPTTQGLDAQKFLNVGDFEAVPLPKSCPQNKP